MYHYYQHKEFHKIKNAILALSTVGITDYEGVEREMRMTRAGWIEFFNKKIKFIEENCDSEVSGSAIRTMILAIAALNKWDFYQN
jgi:hypothetical protein